MVFLSNVRWQYFQANWGRWMQGGKGLLYSFVCFVIFSPLLYKKVKLNLLFQCSNNTSSAWLRENTSMVSNCGEVPCWPLGFGFIQSFSLSSTLFLLSDFCMFTVSVCLCLSLDKWLHLQMYRIKMKRGLCFFMLWSVRLSLSNKISPLYQWYWLYNWCLDAGWHAGNLQANVAIQKASQQLMSLPVNVKWELWLTVSMSSFGLQEISYCVKVCLINFRC